MSLRTPLRTPLYEGGGVSSLVPHVWDCSIGGRTYMFDTKFFGTAQFTRSSIPILKPQQSTGSISEDSLNPADGIRAKIESWHHGAGQTYLDRPESDPYRFLSSKGVDPWTKWRIKLLPDTALRLASASTNLYPVVAGSRLYFSDGQTLKYITDPVAATPTTVTSTPAATVTSIASDGFSVWAAHTASGLYATNTGTGAAAQLVTTALASNSVVGYVKGRLMVSKDNVLYTVTDLAGPAALPTALYTHPNTAFRWVGFAEGLNTIYAAGYSGDKSLIYRTAVKADGTGLDVPVVAGELPDGEIVRSIGSYLGLVLIGTDKGWWTASQDSSGDLSLNKVQDLDAPVMCFEGQGDQVWYGWTNYDDDSTGLGRADLTVDTKGASVLTPAYASDLMATAQGTVQGVVTFQGVRLFTVSGSGLWAETTDKVASGTITSGLITHGMSDNKVALSVTVKHDPLEGEVAMTVAVDGGTPVSIGASATQGTTGRTLGVLASTGEAFELAHTLSRSGDDSTAGPEVTRTTLESNPAPGRGEFFNVAILLKDRVTLGNNNEEDFDCGLAYQSLTGIETAGAPTTYQDVFGTEAVTLEDHDLIIEGFTRGRDAYTGTFLAKFRRPRRRS